MATNISGLTYYKLDASLHGYPGDITKNCALRGEEVDGNFNFLRGQDIKELSIDEKGNLYLTRYDGEVIFAKQPEQDNESYLQGQDIKEASFDNNNNLYLTKYNGDVIKAHLPEKIDNQLILDTDTGLVTMITPEGERAVLNEKTTIELFYDYTIKGDGTKFHPLSVSTLLRTGYHAPAIKLITEGSSLPTKNMSKHDRYVTEERISRFGKLYPSEAMGAITARLNEIDSVWRIPTKEDWDTILNAIDCVVSNHDSTDSNVNLGEFAGASLKSTQYWYLASDGKLLSNDTYGFSILPVGYCGNRGKDFYGSFGKTSAFWTSTEASSEGDMFVKVFDYDKETVAQDSWGGNYLLSLRLVKDSTGDNFNETEYIDGVTYNCVQIPGTNLIWTRDNVAFDNKEYKGFEPEEWADYEHAVENDGYHANTSSIRYFINEWNGTEWEKQEIREGEKIVIYGGPTNNSSMHEWMVNNGELIDIDACLLNTFDEVRNTFNNAIQKEVEYRQVADAQLQANIDAEASMRAAEDEKIYQKISDTVDEFDVKLGDASSAREDADAQIQVNIDNETTARENADIQLQANIDAEASIRTTEDAKIYQKLDEVISEFNEKLDSNSASGENANAQLQANIDAEASIREAQDNILDEKINQERANRIGDYNHFKEILNEEIKERADSHEVITKVLNAEIKERYDGDFNLLEKINTLTTTTDNSIDALALQFNQMITALQEELDATKEELRQLKANAITDIAGTLNEIKVTRQNNTVIIGFADDAHFIAGA